MESSFVEQLVKKRQSLPDICKKLAIVFLGIAAPITVGSLAYVVMTHYLLYVALFMIPFMIYLGWFFFGYINLEFEYSVTAGSLAVDKIIGQRKRKRLLDVNIRDLTAVERVCENNLDERRYAKYIEAAADPGDRERYCATFKSDKFGSAILFFSPDEKILGAMKPYLRVRR